MTLYSLLLLYADVAIPFILIGGSRRDPQFVQPVSSLLLGTIPRFHIRPNYFLRL